MRQLRTRGRRAAWLTGPGCRAARRSCRLSRRGEVDRGFRQRSQAFIGLPLLLQRRIQQHRRARQGRGWETVEEQLDLAGVFAGNGHYNVLLVDCLTLWVNNLMYYADQAGRQVAEADVAEQCDHLLKAAEARRGTVIFVSNEVGLGVVPENAQARRYRDLVGRANQIIAAGADAATLVCCGIPVQLKEKQSP